MNETNISFEDAFRRLEVISSTLEKGNSSVDASIALYEEGCELLSKCYSILENAEQKVSILRKKYDDTPEEVPFIDEDKD